MPMAMIGNAARGSHTIIKMAIDAAAIEASATANKGPRKSNLVLAQPPLENHTASAVPVNSASNSEIAAPVTPRTPGVNTRMPATAITLTTMDEPS